VAAEPMLHPRAPALRWNVQAERLEPDRPRLARPEPYEDRSNRTPRPTSAQPKPETWVAGCQTATQAKVVHGRNSRPKIPTRCRPSNGARTRALSKSHQTINAKRGPTRPNAAKMQHTRQ